MANDEKELLNLLADVLALGAEDTWGIDVADGDAALSIDLLLNHGQHTLIPGRAVSRASEGYGVKARPTPGTPRSSPTRPASAGTCNPCGPVTNWSP